MIELRPAHTGELALLWALRTRAVAAACAGHYSAAVLTAWLDAPAPDSLQCLLAQGGGLVAEEAGQVLGYAVLDAGAEVDAVFVEPAQHGRGIGGLLLGAVEDAARAAGCKRLFLSASLNAVPFYRRAGFVAVREEMYPHRSGVEIPSVFMEKLLG
ncbi:MULTISPECIES: GNAT family N-acetyltransferase [unclassified Massilia]|uniref:GNAT family N-acetyltransferase n=1 Tax=unclassified Massilia TaxID=2609279 RepID=UPI00177E2071|nr:MULTISPECIES: GNAT family N-acetyltransferase [unclassified Massilia]MBD8529088.1 GNAT family N-acetyltransferase [Massilia sp. CFBP 13647]MBD8672482.1 GNAT family N-acetyltransferase [Massilia sp. CFBP 13721]